MIDSIDGGNDDKRTTKDIQGGSNNSKLYGYPRSLGTFAITGKGAGIIEIPIYRADCKRRDSSRYALSSGDTLTGGILRQLIVQSRNQVARRQSDLKRIEEELQELNHQVSEWEELLEALEHVPEETDLEN